MSTRHMVLTGLFAVASIVSVGGAEFTPERTIYVSAAGADNNDGSSLNTPLRSIGKASEIVKPGDLVLVKGGTYREHITLKQSGTKDKPIVFRAMPGETALVTYGWDIADWSKVPNTRFCYKSVFKYAVNMLWERKTLSRYLELETMELLDQQPGAFFMDKKNGEIFVHVFDGGTPESAGIVAVPYSDGKKPVSYDGETGKLSRLYPGFEVNGHFNIIDGFEVAFHPIGEKVWRMGDNAIGCVFRNNTIYGCTCGIVLHWRVANALAENNRIYKAAGTGILVGDKVVNIVVRNNYLFNNGPCDPFKEQLDGGAGHPYNLARYGGEDGLNVDFIGNTVISDDASRRYGVFRCKGGVSGRMIVSGNIFVGGGPHFYAKPDNVSLIKNNSVIQGDISYDKATSTGLAYEPELADNLTIDSKTKKNPCFADTSFYDYRLRKDSPFIGSGAYPEAGEILYVNASLKEEGDGSTPEKAVKTLAAAFKAMPPGSCIYILPGTYKETISLAKMGTEKKVSVRNYGKGQVVFESSQVDFKECGNVSIDGILFKNSRLLFQNSACVELQHCVFDGAEAGIKADNGGIAKIINNTFVGNSHALELFNTPVILRNNLFADCTSIPVKSDPGKTISENNVFTGENAEKILTEWKSAHHEAFSSFTSGVKLRDGYALSNDSTLGFSGLGWTCVGARFAAKESRPIIVENLMALNTFSDRVTLHWETPFDYPDVRITCKDKDGKTVCNASISQGLYKQTVNTECFKGLNANSRYDFTLVFTNPDGVGGSEKTLSVTTSEKKDYQPRSIYVAKSGDDAQSGLAENEARKSISAALAVALPGDTIFVAPGIYTEQIGIDNDGLSKDKPFLLKSVKPGQAIINANCLFDTAISIKHGNHITIDGFKFSGLRYSSITTAVTISKSEGITLKNCIFDRDWRKSGGCSNVQLKCVDVKDIEVSNCIFDSGFHGVFMMNCNNVRIFNNTFWHIGINGVHVGGTKDYVIDIYNNIFENVVGNHNSPAVSTGEHGDKILCDYNLYWKTEAVCPGQKFYGSGGKEYGAPWSVMQKDAPATLEETRTMYGVETHGQFANPLLNDPQRGDFNVKPDSPTIGKGRNGSNVGVDMSVFLK